MKIGTEDKKKSLIAAGLLLVAVVLVVRAFQGGEEASPPPAAPARTAASGAATAANRTGGKNVRKASHPLLAQTLDPTLRFDLLRSSEEVAYQGTGRDIFHSQAPMAEIPKPMPADVHPGPPVPAPPPPIPLKFYGFASRKDGNKRIFLSKGEDIFVAKEGDTVDRRYKVVHIGANSVEVQDVLTNNTQTLPLTLT
jgi:hypothetical protein